MLVRHFISCKELSGVATNSKNDMQIKRKKTVALDFKKNVFQKKIKINSVVTIPQFI